MQPHSPQTQGDLSGKTNSVHLLARSFVVLPPEIPQTRRTCIPRLRPDQDGAAGLQPRSDSGKDDTGRGWSGSHPSSCSRNRRLLRSAGGARAAAPEQTRSSGFQCLTGHPCRAEMRKPHRNRCGVSPWFSCDFDFFGEYLDY